MAQNTFMRITESVQEVSVAQVSIKPRTVVLKWVEEQSHIFCISSFPKLTQLRTERNAPPHNFSLRRMRRVKCVSIIPAFWRAAQGTGFCLASSGVLMEYSLDVCRILRIKNSQGDSFLLLAQFIMIKIKHTT